MPRLRTLAVNGLRDPEDLLAQMAAVADRLEELDLSDTDITDAGLLRLGPLGNLRHLDLGSTPITGPGLAALARCEKLKTLDLAYSQVTGPGLAYLKDAQGLVSLGLSEESVTAEGVAHLKALKGLRRVAIDDGWMIPSKAVTRLQQALPDCEVSCWSDDLASLVPADGAHESP